jgi:hypothetical protein
LSGITLAQAQTQLSAWLAASAAVAQSQSYTIESGGSKRALTRADAAEIRNQIEFWERKIAELSPIGAGGRRRTRYVVPE